MKKIIIFLISIALIMNYVNISAQNPLCEDSGSPYAGNTLKRSTQMMSDDALKSYRNLHFEGEGCSFRFALKDPFGFGWNPGDGIEIIVDGLDYGFVTVPWGTPSVEVIKLLPSGEVQCTFIGGMSPFRHCFDIYNSLNELIYQSPYFGDFDSLFLIYQNECCTPLTDFAGVYIQEENQVNLSWTAPASTDLTGFDIYRNDELIEHVSPSTVSYSDNTAELEEGEYKYCVVPVYPFECTLDEECFETYISNVGITNYKDNILVYPNPANKIVNISGVDVVNIKVFNNMGQLLLTKHNTNSVNVSELTNGIYILSIEVSTGYIIYRKVIINR